MRSWRRSWSAETLAWDVEIDANILQEYSRHILCPIFFMKYCWYKLYVGFSLGNLWLEVLDELVTLLVHEPEVELRVKGGASQNKRLGTWVVVRSKNSCVESIFCCSFLFVALICLWSWVDWVKKQKVGAREMGDDICKEMQREKPYLSTTLARPSASPPKRFSIWTLRPSTLIVTSGSCTIRSLPLTTSILATPETVVPVKEVV